MDYMNYFSYSVIIILKIFLIQKKIIMQEINEILSLLLERFKAS